MATTGSVDEPKFERPSPLPSAKRSLSDTLPRQPVRRSNQVQDQPSTSSSAKRLRIATDEEVQPHRPPTQKAPAPGPSVSADTKRDIQEISHAFPETAQPHTPQTGSDEFYNFLLNWDDEPL
ncbi:hypothetical protein FJU08_18975 [Martelella alba]|uniref:Uncharacterized protein n=1 Tax=Martelella alba TaxID=2590451 RepID=A0A506U451_9HYPH|nr:hypothetical protein [Martelella alba]TPW27814.1 hypothetical protein FJU08_18975 [Martelella alba]